MMGYANSTSGGFVRNSPTDATSHSCGCIGPQNGEPLCPCQMRGAEVRNGRYVRVTDLGPVR